VWTSLGGHYSDHQNPRTLYDYRDTLSSRPDLRGTSWPWEGASALSCHCNQGAGPPGCLVLLVLGKSLVEKSAISEDPVLCRWKDSGCVQLRGGVIFLVSWAGNS
jgi:hypothetical protein